MSVITQDFVAAGKPTYIVANAGVMYTDITDGMMYQQTTIPYGKSWKVVSNQNVYVPTAGKVAAVTASAPLQAVGTTNPNISIPKADATTDGYLSSADWNAFSSGTGGVPTTRLISTTAPLQGGGDLSADRTLSIPQADTTTDGYLTATDWNTFNNKGSGTVTSVGATSPITSSGGATPNISTSMNTDRLIGRTTAGAGVMEEISVGSGLSLSAGTLSATPTASYYLIAYDDTIQMPPDKNIGYPITATQTVATNEITISGSQILFNFDGIYNIEFSVQLKNVGAQEHDVDIWFVLNGTAIPWSNSRVSVVASHGSVYGHCIAAWNFMLSITHGDIVELFWQTNDTDVSIESLPPSFDAPDTPSVIITVNQI